MIKLCAIIILGVCVFNYCVDYLFYLKDRYCRFHIGRWDPERWPVAIEKTARRWVHRTPTVKITDNSRYMLLDILNGKYRSQSIQSWQKAALIMGLLESDNKEAHDMARKAAADLIDAVGNWKKNPVAVDCGMLSLAIMQAIDDPQRIRPAMDYTCSLIEKNINDEGMISYTGGKDNPEMYVDTLGLTCAFLARYANVYNMPRYEEIAFRQLEMYHEYGLYKDTALPNHAFHIKTKLPLGVYGWGRGTAWYIIGLMDTYHEFRTEMYRTKVLEWIFEAADYYSCFQHEDGGFGAILQRAETYDSSATAALAWFYEWCYVLSGRKSYCEIADRCLCMLRRKTRITGAIDYCQGDTKGIGTFAQTYDIMPFAQGMALRAINLKRNR